MSVSFRLWFKMYKKMRFILFTSGLSIISATSNLHFDHRLSFT